MLWEVKTGSNLARICKYRVQKVEQKQQIVASEKKLWSNLLAHFDHRNFYCFTLNFFFIERWFNDWYTCLVGRRKARRAKQKFKFKTENKGESTQKRTRLIIFNTLKIHRTANKTNKEKREKCLHQVYVSAKIKEKNRKEHNTNRAKQTTRKQKQTTNDSNHLILRNK